MNVFMRATSLEARLFCRNFSSVFFTFAFPTLMIFIFGGIYGNTPTPVFGGMGTLDVSVPAYIGLVIGVTGLMSFPLSVAEDRERRVYKRFRATPADPSMIVLAQLIVNVVMTIVGILVLVAVGLIAYHIRIRGAFTAIVPATLLSIVGIYSIGLFVASVSPNMKTANAISNLIYFIMIFLSGATIPIEIFPSVLKSVAKFLPMYYVVDMMKKTFAGKAFGSVSLDVAILSVMTLGLILAAFLLYRKKADF